MKDLILFFFTGFVSVLMGVLAHLGFNNMIDASIRNRSINLIARYTIGILFATPAYMLARLAQHKQYKEKTPHIARIVGDFLLVFLGEGAGVMLPRLWRWWRG